MDNSQDWLKQIDIEAWQRRIRQLRQELRDGRDQPQGSPLPSTQVLPTTEVRGKSLTVRLNKRGAINKRIGI